MGDFEFKPPAIYTNKVFLNAEPGFKVHSKVEEFILRSKTPPYLGNTAEVHHRTLSSKDRYLILCSDGLYDCYREKGPNPSDAWAKSIVAPDRHEASSALRILRNAIGGTNADLVSRNLTVSQPRQFFVCIV